MQACTLLVWDPWDLKNPQMAVVHRLWGPLADIVHQCHSMVHGICMGPVHGDCTCGGKKKETSDFYGFEIELGYARHIDSYDQSIEYIRGCLIRDCKLMARHGKFHIFPPSWVISRTKQSNCICESVTMAPAPSPVSKFLSCHLASDKSRRTDDDWLRVQHWASEPPVPPTVLSWINFVQDLHVALNQFDRLSELRTSSLEARKRKEPERKNYA